MCVCKYVYIYKYIRYSSPKHFTKEWIASFGWEYLLNQGLYGVPPPQLWQTIDPCLSSPSEFSVPSTRSCQKSPFGAQCNFFPCLRHASKADCSAQKHIPHSLVQDSPFSLWHSWSKTTGIFSVASLRKNEAWRQLGDLVVHQATWHEVDTVLRRIKSLYELIKS